MDNFNVIENLDKLPPLLQFIIILAWFTIPPILSIWRIHANSESNRNEIKAQSDAKLALEKELTEQKSRLEALEIQAIKAKADAKQAEAASENTQKLIEVIGASNDRFQRVLDVKSERQLEADKMQHETNKMFLDAVNRQTDAVSNLTEMLEIQTEHYSNFVEKLDTTLKTVETIAQDNRADVTTALGLSVNYRADSENALRTILQTIHSIAADVREIIGKNEAQKSQTLLAINTKLQALENSVNTLIAPRAAVLGDTIPIPDLQHLPEITGAANEAAEKDETHVQDTQ